MKKTLIGIVTVAFVVLMITNASACLPPGMTPGFWKHNIKVRLGLTNGAYSALPDGTKLTNAMMDGYLTTVRSLSVNPTLTFAQALAYLNLPGWSADRTNMANWFNAAAGYGPFVD